MEPKSIPKRLKIEVDFQERKKHSSRPSWGHLGSILSRSWDPSWVIFSTPNRHKSHPRGDFFVLKFRLRFWIDFCSILPPQMPPFWHPFRIKIDQKIDAKSDCAKGRSKIAPRAPKSLPRRLPDPPRTPPDRPKTAQDPPKTPPGHPQDPPKTLCRTCARWFLRVKNGP